MDDLLAFGGLFVAAFTAATLLPAQSEAVLVGLQLAGYPPVWLVCVASLGNTLGAVVNWALGRGLMAAGKPRWLQIPQGAVGRASAWYRRWGRWSLLLSWLPLGGDALTVAAGALREPLWSFVLLVGLAKTARYIVLAAVTAGMT
ncbi:MAG: YqaA family protein [Rhizobiaceae bacterium]